MAQHFLLTSAARTLSLASVMRMSDEEAEQTFIKLRWSGNDGKAFCPHCGCRPSIPAAGRTVPRVGGARRAGRISQSRAGRSSPIISYRSKLICLQSRSSVTKLRASRCSRCLAISASSTRRALCWPTRCAKRWRQRSARSRSAARASGPRSMAAISAAT